LVTKIHSAHETFFFFFAAAVYDIQIFDWNVVKMW